MPGPWIRTCQECGNEQKDVEPKDVCTDNMSDAYRYRKCKRCKSEALDFGTHMSEAQPQEDGE